MGMIQGNAIFGWVRLAMWSGAAVLLFLPAIAMTFFPQAGVDWTGSDFAVMGVLLLAACGLVEFGMRLARNNFAYFLGTAFAVGVGFLTVWVNLAVGMIGDDNPQNLVFAGVLLLALGGALAVKFQPRRLVTVMTAAGVAQALIGLVVLVAALDAPVVAALIAGFAVPWFLSAACFRTAARQM